ncbi:hypothetical protein PV08_11361 [Exophiala spinifera]|uniref:Uncharacterized protein n=1 Tax=Exophiala spinifera TaxID=91928 RepID=A0A0D2BGB6_9EURO|nr:uncharacterized protein PV08_11361 [Exophiala spinifera]KIW10399.1 hypothetical protein PV08_11361 [Exophiala spinifera]
MESEDDMTTPRVLKAQTPSARENQISQSSRTTSRRFSSLSFRSLSGSWSSFWGRESSSRSHTDLSEESASYACVPFTAFVPSHHSISQPAQRRFPIYARNNPLSTYSCSSSVSRLPSNHVTIHKKARSKSTSSHKPDKLLAKSTPSPDTSQTPEGRKGSTFAIPSRAPFRRVLSKAMTTNTTLSGDSAHGDCSSVTEPSVLRRLPSTHHPSIEGVLRGHITDVGESSTLSRALPTLERGLHRQGSGRVSPNTAGSSETQATTYSGMFRPRGSVYYDAPNPLLVPPPPSAHSGIPSISASDASLIRQGLMSTNRIRLPPISALTIDTYTFMVHSNDPKYRAIAHVVFDLSAREQNSLHRNSDVNPYVPDPPYNIVQAYSGFLHELSIETSVSGPCVQVSQIGLSSVTYLNNGDRWVVVVSVGIKDTSLASRLSTSLRHRQSNNHMSPAMAMVDHFLDVLKTEKDDESVVVSAVIRYKHGFLPPDTKLVSNATVTIDHVAGIDACNRVVRDHYEEVAPAVLSALLPGVDDVALSTVSPPSHSQYARTLPMDGLRLLQDFDSLFGGGVGGALAVDLSIMEAYYLDAARDEVAVLAAPSLVRRLVKRLSNN